MQKLYSENHQIKFDPKSLGLFHAEAGKALDITRLEIEQSGHEPQPVPFSIPEPQVLRTELFELTCSNVGAIPNPGYRVHVDSVGIVTINEEPGNVGAGFTLNYSMPPIPKYETRKPKIDMFKRDVKARKNKKKMAVASRKRNRK